MLISLICSFLSPYTLKEDFPQVSVFDCLLSLLFLRGIYHPHPSLQFLFCMTHISNSNPHTFLEFLPLNFSWIFTTRCSVSQANVQLFVAPFAQNEMELCNMADLPSISNSTGSKRNSESPGYHIPSASSPSDLISINAILRVIFSDNFPFLRHCVLIFFTLIVKLYIT